MKARTKKILCLRVLLHYYNYHNSRHNVKKRKRLPAFHVNPYLRVRNLKGRFFRDFEDLKKHKLAFNENFHMDANTFENIFMRLEERLMSKKSTRKDNISAKQKFTAVLEFLASGDLQRHIASVYRISKQHFGTLIDQVCDAICEEFSDEIPMMNKEEFERIANGFNTRWEYPNCIGAIDGKHVGIKAPPNSGSLFYNYKGFFSIVILAVCDSEYKFTYLDIGAYGSESDANIFAMSSFGQKVISNELDFPPDKTIEGEELPYHFVGDGAFPLARRMMKPFSNKDCLSDEERIFNYRLSRARRCIENAFGILSTKWLCLKKTMFCNPDRAQKIIMACCMLHNYLMNVKTSSYCPQNYVDREKENEKGDIVPGEWRQLVRENSFMNNNLRRPKGRQMQEGKIIRNKLMRFFNTTGAVPWQRKQAGLE